MRRTLVITMLAIGLAGCGSRVDTQPLGAAPSLPPAAASAVGAPVSTIVTPSAPSTTQAGRGTPDPISSTPISSTPISSGPTTTAATPTTAPTTATTVTRPPKDPSRFDKAAFCAAVRVAPLQDIRGFAVVERTQSAVVATQFADIERLAPSYLDGATGDLKKPVDLLAAKVAAGQITDQTQLQDWIMALDPATLAAWVSGQRQVLAWTDANC